MTGGHRPRNTGKAFEGEVAHKIGGKRAGYGNLELPDVSNSWLDVECKVMTLPAKLEGAFHTVKTRGEVKKVPIVVLKEKGKEWSEARVYMSFNDFLDWFGGD